MLYPNWKSLTLLVCLTPAWAASAPLVGSDLLPRVVQDEEDKPEELPDKREEVKNLLENLKNHAKARGTQDADAQGVIETLMKEFPQSGPKDRVSIVKGIGQIFKEKRKQAEDGTFDNTLYLAAAYALGEMGPESVAELTSWIGNKTHRSNLLLQEKLIQSLGKTKHPDAVKPLLDLLGNKDFAIEAAGAQALNNFGELEIKARKKVFEERSSRRS
ncbi:MAG: HEAT repeat domain-containing protein [Planctomycetota bacterium]